MIYDYSRIEFLERQLDLEYEKQTLIEAIPDLSQFEDDTVLFFKMRFQPEGKLYTYLALKCIGLWYTTGPRSPKGYSNEQFRAWLAGNYITELWIDVEWEQVI
jgi:hypothetical protein